MTNTSSSDVTVFTTADDKIETTVRLPDGAGPFGVVASPDGRQVFVSNSGTGTISVIDPSSNATC